MATGKQDYYRGVDVAYQELAQVIVRPKYGGALLESDSRQIGEGAPIILFEVAGKGMTYGGVVWLDHTLTQANSIVAVDIDDQVINDLSFVRLRDYGITNPLIWPVTLLDFDTVYKIYAVGFSYGLTFEKNLKVWYEDKYNTAPTVHWRFVYTLL